MIKIAKRIPALIIKEFLSLFKDPKGRLTLIAPPILQLLIFSFAATLEVKNVSVVVLNQDKGKHGHEIIQRINASPTFTKMNFVKKAADFKDYIDQQKAIVAINIPQDFSRNLNAENTAKMQIILDGRRSTAAQSVSSYITDIVNQYNQEIKADLSLSSPLATIVSRNWFNANLLYLWFTVPSLVVILSMLITLVVTSLSVARERELGTFDQLLISPLKPYEILILIGKTVPAVIIGFIEGLIIWAVGISVFKIPFTGSFLLLLFSMLIFVLSVVGVGLFISSLSKTQQQAILGAFIFIVLAVTLSGFAAPIENMPTWMQKVTCINPMKHALIIVKGIFLKDMSFVEVWSNTWPLLIIGSITMSLAGWFFTRRLE